MQEILPDIDTIYEEKPSRKLLNWIMYLGIAGALALMILVAFWMFYPYKPVVANYQPFRIIDEDKILKAGDTLVYFSDSCRNFIGEVEVYRILVNDVLLEFTPFVHVQDKKECTAYDNHSVVLPAHIPDGKYHLEIVSIVKVNPIRHITTKVITEDFMVKNPLLDIDREDVKEILQDLNQ